jgi:hypothetical protein
MESNSICKVRQAAVALSAPEEAMISPTDGHRAEIEKRIKSHPSPRTTLLRTLHGKQDMFRKHIDELDAAIKEVE